MYFQNGNNERFHAEFATRHLDPFVGMTRQEFDSISLHEAGHRLYVRDPVFPEVYEASPQTPFPGEHLDRPVPAHWSL